MKMTRKCDVFIVGAATTGIYLGWQIAKQGHSVLIIDKNARNQVGQRLEIIHFHRKTMKDLNIPPPTESPEFLFNYKGISVSRLPLFLQRMYKVLESDGVEFEFSCRFKELIFENNRIIGAKVEKDNTEIEIKTRLVVDASGIASCVRTSLPEDYGIETWNFDSSNQFFVILHYIKWIKSDEKHPEWGDIWPYYFVFFDPGYTKTEAIMGIAGPESYEKAAILTEELISREKFPEFELIKKEYNPFAFSRTPYSLVADGFFCAGDSASITNPLAARGIPETWRLCNEAADVISKALKTNEYLSREALWDVNVRYFRGIGSCPKTKSIFS